MSTEQQSKSVRIGAGSGGSRSSPQPAAELAKKGDISYLCCDRLAERSLANAVAAKKEGHSEGYNPGLEQWFEEVLPHCVERNITIIGSFGAASPNKAAKKVAEIAERQGVSNLTVASIKGDDVTEYVENNLNDLENIETDEPLADSFASYANEMVSANAYTGADPIVEALDQGADVVITGRVSDASLFVGPLRYEFGWGPDNHEELAIAATVGHILECGHTTTGGYLAEPGYVEVPDMHNIPEPLAEVSASGDVYISKPPASGGVVNELSVAAQLGHEVHDPANYLTPDIVVDMSDIRLEQVKANKVKVEGFAGKPKPEMLKVLVGMDEGYITEMEFGWAGVNSYQKAKQTIDQMIEPIVEGLQSRIEISEIQTDIIGVDSFLREAAPEPEIPPNEVRLRLAARVPDEKTAETFYTKVSGIYLMSHKGSDGLRKTINSKIGTYPTLIPREIIGNEIHYWTVDDDVEITE